MCSLSVTCQIVQLIIFIIIFWSIMNFHCQEIAVLILSMIQFLYRAYQLHSLSYLEHDVRYTSRCWLVPVIRVSIIVSLAPARPRPTTSAASCGLGLALCPAALQPPSFMHLLQVDWTTVARSWRACLWLKLPVLIGFFAVPPVSLHGRKPKYGIVSAYYA